jgi:hypothetical protein
MKLYTSIEVLKKFHACGDGQYQAIESNGIIRSCFNRRMAIKRIHKGGKVSECNYQWYLPKLVKQVALADTKTGSNDMDVVVNAYVIGLPHSSEYHKVETALKCNCTEIDVRYMVMKTAVCQLAHSEQIRFIEELINQNFTNDYSKWY